MSLVPFSSRFLLAPCLYLLGEVTSSSRRGRLKAQLSQSKVMCSSRGIELVDTVILLHQALCWERRSRRRGKPGGCRCNKTVSMTCASRAGSHLVASQPHGLFGPDQDSRKSRATLIDAQQMWHDTFHLVLLSYIYTQRG